MTPQEQTPKATINQDELSHSGDLGLEQPVIDLDKPLKDAHKDGQVTVPSNVDQGFEAERRIQAERAEREAGKNKFLAFLKKPIGKVAVAGAGLSLAVTAGIGIGASGSQNNGPSPSGTSTSGPEKPGQNNDTVPAEAREFVDQYGVIFHNPVATYYAQEAYAAEHGGATVIDQPYIDSYVKTDGIDQESSDLGFWRTYVPLDQPVNKETFTTFINDMAIQSCLDRYLNLVAKNPLPEATAIIDNEFLKYCGGIGSGSSASGSDNREHTLTLMQTMKTIANKYGSEANYKIAPASLDETAAESATVVEFKPVIDSVNEDNLVTNFHAPITLRVDVDVYDENNKVITQKESVDMRLTVARVAPTGPVDPGRVIIGQK